MVAGRDDGIRIGTISRFMDAHLRHDYGVPQASLVPFADGLATGDWTRLSQTWQADPSVAALPPEFVLTLGRAEPYKGFDDLLDAYAAARARNRHSPARDRDDHRGGKQSVPTESGRADRPTRSQCGHGSAVHSRRRRPAAASWRARRRRTITGRAVRSSTHGGIRRRRRPCDCYHSPWARRSDSRRIDRVQLPAHAPGQLADALASALAVDTQGRFAIARRAHQLALRDFNHPATVHAMLTQVAPWLRLPEAADRLRLLTSSTPSMRPENTVSRPSVKVPIGPQARHWNTVRPERLVLVVAHHVTSLVRLLDVLPVFDSDPRIQLVFTCNGSDSFTHGLDHYLDRLGVVTIPWHQAVGTEFDLVIAANHGGLTEITGPLVILEHGAGYSKNSPGDRRPETGDRRPETGDRSVFGLSPEWVLYNGRPIADSLVLAHHAEFDRLAALTPAAVSAAVVAGDPSYDRMLASRHLRHRYRDALGVESEQTLVTLCSTWSPRSLMGTLPELFREILACLDRDRYRVAGLIHPNIWHGHGPWQVHTWLADGVRSGLLLPPPAEGWQATLIASDIVLGDHGATSCYAASLDLPVVLATFPEEDVAPGSVGALLGQLARRLNRHESLATQIDRARAEYRPGTFDSLRDLVTSYPGEAVDRLRALCYRHLRLSVPESAAVTPVIPVERAAMVPRSSVAADYAVCTVADAETPSIVIARYPAGVAVDRSRAGYLDAAFLVVHEDHPQEALRTIAPVIITAAPATGQDATAVLTDAFTRFRLASVVAVGLVDRSLVWTRDGRAIIASTPDPGIGAAIVYHWLLTRPRHPLPTSVPVTLGQTNVRVELTSSVRAETGA
jgi:hypothetical protein